MSIADNPIMYEAALRRAHAEFPSMKSYRKNHQSATTISVLLSTAMVEIGI